MHIVPADKHHNVFRVEYCVVVQWVKQLRTFRAHQKRLVKLFIWLIEWAERKRWPNAGGSFDFSVWKLKLLPAQMHISQFPGTLHFASSLNCQKIIMLPSQISSAITLWLHPKSHTSLLYSRWKTVCDKGIHSTHKRVDKSNRLTYYYYWSRF